MKGINLNGTIKTYGILPKTWNNVIGLNYMSDEQLKAIGFYDVVKPNYNFNTQELGEVYFDGSAEIFTYPVIDKTWTETISELKEIKIKELKSHYFGLLSKTDWYTARAQEGIDIPQEILDQRALLRTECNTHENAINSLNTKADIVSYSYQ